MEIIKEIKEIIGIQDSDEKDSRLSVLNGGFEYNDELDKADVVEGTRLLLAAALQEDNKVLRKKFFQVDWKGNYPMTQSRVGTLLHTLTHTSLVFSLPNGVSKGDWFDHLVVLN